MGSGTLYNLVARVTFLISGYALQFSMARWLPSPVEFGRFSVLISLITLARLIFSAGVPQSLSKFVAADPGSAQGTYQRGLRLQLIGALVVWISFVALTPILTALLGDEALRSPLLLASPLIVFLALYQLNLGYFAGRLWFGWQAIWTFVYSVTRYALPAAFVLAGLGINGALIGLLCSTAGVALLSWLAIPRVRQPSLTSTRQFLDFSWPLMIFSFGVNALLNFDLLLLKRYFPASADVGFYSGAVNLGKAPYFAFYAFSTTALPALSRAHASGDMGTVRSELGRQVRYLVLAALPAGGLLAASAPEALRLVYGKNYVVAAWPLALLALSTCALSLMVVLTSALTACGKPRTSMMPIFICLPAQWLLGVLLIPRQGMLGAATSNTLATLLGLLAAWLSARRTIGKVIGPHLLASALVSTLIAALALLCLPSVTGVWVILKIGLGFALYSAAILLTRGVALAEVKAVGRRVVSSWR